MHPFAVASGTFAIWAGLVVAGIFIGGMTGGVLLAAGLLLGCAWTLLGSFVLSAVRK